MGHMVVVLVLLVVIALVVFGVALIGFTLKLLLWALVGLAIGALARLVLPGAQRIGLLATGGAGLAGALLGGIIGDAADVSGFLQLVLAVALAALLIAALGGLRSVAA